MSKMTPVLFFAVSCMLLAFTLPTESYRVDLDKSTVSWTGYKVTGKHTGTLSLSEGSLEMADGRIAGGAFKFDMSSITVTDLEGGGKSKLEGHLKSDDFFGVEKFPSGNFNITSVSRGKDEGNINITGDLTLKGITQPISFPASVTMDDAGISAEAMIKVDRTKYNIRYGSGSFFDNLGDNAIYDEFDLNITLKASK
ncbi:MAG: YceI family protein [Saprospiraceae bacterium]|nr:YceI family protein [Saprospiraceae bacterium]